MTPALALLALLAADVPPEGAVDKPVVQIESVSEHARRLVGAKSSVALAKGPAGPTLYGLAGGGGPEERKPWHLWRLQWQLHGTALTVLRELPEAEDVVGPLAADVDRDGNDDLVVFVPGRALLLRAGPDGSFAGTPETLVEDGALEVHDTDLRRPSGVTLEPGRLCTAVVGAFRCWSGDAASLPWGVSVEVPLPIALARGRDGLRLTGMPVQRLPGPEVLFAAGFKVEGPERLRVLLIDPDAPGEARTTECWLRLPAPERVLEHAFFRLDGRPALAVTTIPMGSLSLFGEKKIRVWVLAADRTRTGKPPVLAVTSSMNLWQAAYWYPGDVDGDGREDLVLGYWKGLKDSRVVLETWMQKADGTFGRGNLGAAFDLEEGDRSALRFGTDATGDDRPDLLVMANGSLEVHAGVPGKAFVAKAASRTVGVGGSGSQGTEISIGGDDGPSHQTFPQALALEDPIQPADLDGDGTPEWLILPSLGHPWLTLVSLPR